MSVLLLSAVAIRSPAQTTTPPSPLTRRDSAGTAIGYHMHATNQSRDHTERYDADAHGFVVRDSAGHSIDALTWSHLVIDDTAQQLAANGASVEQRLGFAPGFLVPPNIAQADPRLTGPVLDLFTFYVDWWLAARNPAIARAGDKAHIPSRTSNSWANGANVLVGSDAVDFDMQLVSVDSAAHLAVLDVQHLPPDSARVEFPAEWMRPPLGGAPNNWVQIETSKEGFIAGVGRETFDDRLVIDLLTGQIVSATMDNPVDIVERICTDRALTHCGAQSRYRILRRIEVKRITP